MHADLFIRDLTDALAAKDPPVTQRGIPVSAIYAGMISNACEATITGRLTLSGDSSGCLLSPVGSISPLAFGIGSWDGSGFPWTISVPQGAPGQLYQQHLDITRDGVLLGRFVISIVLLDLAGPDAETLAKPPATQGAITFLQVQPDDWVRV